MAKRAPEFKPLLYTTTVRNPERVKSLLNVFVKFDGMVLTDDLATKIVCETIRYGLYRPKKQSASIKAKWQSTHKGVFAEEILTEAEVRYLKTNNPQNHKEAGFKKGYPSRFATIFDFAKELGFVYFTPNEPIQFSEIGRMLSQVYEVNVSEGFINIETIHPDYEQKAFLQAMAKSQRKNPFVRVLNDNIPLVLLVEVIKLLNANPDYLTTKGETKGIARHELPLIIFWKDNDARALYQRIVRLREEYKYSPSDETICDICINEIMQGKFKEFDMHSIMVEYPDEFIRKMRITGLFSLRGAGRFLDINHNEEDKVNYILENYANYQHYTDEKEYFNYMATIDSHLFEVESKPITANQAEELLQNWVDTFSWTVIQQEMINLQNHKHSENDVLKLLSNPVRLEFLTALCIKSKLPKVRVIPNYACDDTGLPTSTAGGGVGDVECYENLNGILVEVTMAEGRTQTVMEIWPIERHLTEFQEKTNPQSQAIFIAPSIYHDSRRQIEFVKSTSKKEIRPYTIEQFINFLNDTKTLYVA